MSREIHILTGNPGKLAAAQRAFAQFDITIVPVNKEYPEIQADTSAQIARDAAVRAAQELGVPVIREDHSLFIHALGIPGPYTQFMERALPPDKLAQALASFSDDTGYFELALVYAEPSGRVEEYVSVVPVRFARAPRGTLSTGWNTLLMLEGDSRTFAEYPETERRAIFGKNYVALGRALQAKS